MTEGEWRRGDFLISTDRARLDRSVIHDFLKSSYWAPKVPRAIVDRSIDNALCFGVYEASRQVGFARIISDFATFAYLADVFVLESHRGRGLGVWLIETIRNHPNLQNLRRWMLVTRDAHGLYLKFGFTSLSHPERLMEIVDPEVYNWNIT
jgi:GNAT superfamily N-acetyltransferase